MVCARCHPCESRGHIFATNGPPKSTSPCQVCGTPWKYRNLTREQCGTLYWRNGDVFRSGTGDEK